MAPTNIHPMAGRIKDEDIQLVRERARIDEVIEQYVTLKNAGGGSRKGLCPFHDEKSPSFNVRPVRRVLSLLRLWGRSVTCSGSSWRSRA